MEIYNSNKIAYFKLYILQYRYKLISKYIIKLTEHINNLDTFYLLEVNKKNILLSIIYNINKNINNEYNNLIINFTNSSLGPEFNEIFSQLQNINDNDVLFDLLKPFLKLINLPFENQINEIKEIIKEVGYYSLNDMLSIIYTENITKNLSEFLNEIDKVFIPTSINFYNVDLKNEDYYWRIPKTFNKDDILELTRELWIKTTF